MKERGLLKWIIANAFGLGLGVVAVLQTGMLIEFGFDWNLHWNWVEKPVSQDAAEYVSTLLAMLIGGVFLGSAQCLILIAHKISVIRWMFATVAGFGVVAVTILWPLIALGILGVIPGPVEPIILTVGGGAFAGIFQYQMLRRQGIHLPKWLFLWIAGLVASLVPMALLFMSLEGLRVALSWPMEIFLSGFVVAGVAAWISGKALFAVLSEEPDPGHGSESSV